MTEQYRKLIAGSYDELQRAQSNLSAAKRHMKAAKKFYTLAASEESQLAAALKSLNQSYENICRMAATQKIRMK